MLEGDKSKQDYLDHGECLDEREADVKPESKNKQSKLNKDYNP